MSRSKIKLNITELTSSSSSFSLRNWWRIDENKNKRKRNKENSDGTRRNSTKINENERKINVDDARLSEMWIVCDKSIFSRPRKITCFEFDSDSVIALSSAQQQLWFILLSFFFLLSNAQNFRFGVKSMWRLIDSIETQIWSTQFVVWTIYFVSFVVTNYSRISKAPFGSTISRRFFSKILNYCQCIFHY